MAELETTDSFYCENCGRDFAPHDFLLHLSTVHNVQERGGTKQLLTHIDFQGGHASTYKWTVGGIVAVQSCSTRKIKRGKS